MFRSSFRQKVWRIGEFNIEKCWACFFKIKKKVKIIITENNLIKKKKETIRVSFKFPSTSFSCVPSLSPLPLSDGNFCLNSSTPTSWPFVGVRTFGTTHVIVNIVTPYCHGTFKFWINAEPFGNKIDRETYNSKIVK